jgi:two-component system, LytTR family, sensor kinase
MAKLKQFYQNIYTKLINNPMVLYHSLAWLIYFLLTNLNFYIGSGGKSAFINIFSHMVLVAVTIFYSNVYIVAPYFLPRKMYFGQVLGVLILFIVFALGRYLLDFKLLPLIDDSISSYKVFDKKFIYDTIWFANQYLLLSFGYWAALRNITTEKEKRMMIQQLIDYERKTNQLEKDFLRSQISPHFIYNVLSSVYTKVHKMAPEVAEPIILLSEMMSYTTKSSKFDEEVMLEEELENIERFLALEKFRYDKNFYVDYNVNGYPDRDDKILPLIFLTFIENAFKYGERTDPSNPITINVDINDNCISFICKNLKNRIKDSIKSNNVGISNTHRRLDLKYNNRYSLDISNLENDYIVTLKIFQE